VEGVGGGDSQCSNARRITGLRRNGAIRRKEERRRILSGMFHRKKERGEDVPLRWKQGAATVCALMSTLQQEGGGENRYGRRKRGKGDFLPFPYLRGREEGQRKSIFYTSRCKNTRGNPREKERKGRKTAEATFTSVMTRKRERKRGTRAPCLVCSMSNGGKEKECDVWEEGEEEGGKTALFPFVGAGKKKE